MQALKNNSFTVTVPIENTDQQVHITPSETTDGIAFYICAINGDDIAQLRKDEQYWKLLWGELPEEAVIAIGAAIEAKILNE